MMPVPRARDIEMPASFFEPPDSTFMRDCPMSAHPPIPPVSPLKKLPRPWPRHCDRRSEERRAKRAELELYSDENALAFRLKLRRSASLLLPQSSHSQLVASLLTASHLKHPAVHSGVTNSVAHNCYEFRRVHAFAEAVKRLFTGSVFTPAPLQEAHVAQKHGSKVFVSFCYTSSA